MPETFVGMVTIQATGGAEIVNVDPDSNSVQLTVKNKSGVPMFTVDAGQGVLVLGASGNGGKIVVADHTGGPAITLDSDYKAIHAGALHLSPGVNLDAGGDVVAGGFGTDGQIQVKDGTNNVGVRVDAKPARVIVGAPTTAGDVQVNGDAGDTRIRLLGQTGTVFADTVYVGEGGKPGHMLVVRDSYGKDVLVLDGYNADIVAGGKGRDGTLIIRNSGDKDILTVTTNDLDQGSLTVGGTSEAGSLSVQGGGGQTSATLSGIAQNGVLALHSAGKLSILLQAGQGSIEAGGPAAPGNFKLKSTSHGVVIALSAATGDIVAGGGGQNGTVRLKNTADDDVVLVDAATGDIVAGGGNQNGALRLKNTAGADVIALDAASGDIVAGGQGQAADLKLLDHNGKDTLHLRAIDGMLRVGGNGQHGDILVLRADNSMGIQLNGQAGDIIIPNADCAEEFDIAAGPEIEPGTTVVLDEHGRLRPSIGQYDRKVVGVIAGASEFRPGIVLDRRQSTQPRAALSMVGKVYCKVDAGDEPVEVGDLLTTSATPGHAMKASDPAKAFGAVIGKALGSLRGGRGLIPILVALQ